jgi:hypothetical protein
MRRKNIPLVILYILLLAFLFAYLEIQIEGTKGWAVSLPTWRRRWLGMEWTGYHLAVWGFLLLFAHFPFVLFPWTGKGEAFVLSFLVLLLLIEDCLWFFLNRRFCGDDRWRRPKLGGLVPYFYFICAFLVLVFSFLTGDQPWIIASVVLLLVALASYPFQLTRRPVDEPQDQQRQEKA